jgi:hypothetical protein
MNAVIAARLGHPKHFPDHKIIMAKEFFRGAGVPQLTNLGSESPFFI